MWLRIPSLLLVMLAISACSLWPEQPVKSGIVHVVLVWLKEPGNAAHRQQIIEGARELAEIPGVQVLTVGPPLPSDRAVVEGSYDVGITLHFADPAALQAYLKHPLHQRQVREVFAPVMQRFRVIDIDGR